MKQQDATPLPAPESATSIKSIDACNKYREKACSCSDRSQRKRLCALVSKTMPKWEKQLANAGGVAQVDKQCRDSLDTLDSLCP